MKDDEWVTGNIRLMLGGMPLEMRLTVPANPVKPHRILPILQKISDSFSELGESAIANAGGKISCQKGCAACCRQAVPLSEIEVYKIAEIVEGLPEPRRSEVKEKFEKAWRHFYHTGWFEKLDNCINFSKEEREKVILEYFNERVSCPFLEDEACSIHAERPLACREYLVTSPAENCSTLSKDTVRMVELPVKPSEIVRQIAMSENLNKTVNFVPLVLALEWAEKYPNNFPEKTGEQWMADFFTRLTKSEIPV